MLVNIHHFLRLGIFIPQVYCYMWKPELVTSDITENVVMAIACYSIFFALIWFFLRQTNLLFHLFLLLFGVLIVTYATAHLVVIWSLWHPTDWFLETITLLATVLSGYIALRLTPLMSRVLSLPNSAQLETANQELERENAEHKEIEQVLRLQANQEQLVSAITHRIRQSLQLDEILNTTVVEIRQLLKIDRVLIYRFETDWSGTVTIESVDPSWISLLGKVIADPCLAYPECIQRYSQGYVQAIADVEVANLALCYQELLAQMQARANLVVPILLHSDQVWGLLTAQNCSEPHFWNSQEIDLLQQLATQVGIAIQQAQLYQEIQQLNTDLEAQVQERTTQLQQALNFESLLKRITDQVRDSLDEATILQTAVRELALGLNTSSCDAGLYDMDKLSSTICYEFVCCPISSLQGTVIRMSDNAAIYQQLLNGQYLQFSWLPYANHVRLSAQTFAVLAYPLIDDQSVIGDLWLHRVGEAVFEEAEIRLVEQVANQCAIAIRQARLYQSAQIQVQELQRLNYLKDDFLSTVSHELRTPMYNVQMATRMLEILLEPTGILMTESNSVGHYFQILQNECQREINLINDLLDLSRLNAEVEPLILTTINLSLWICHLLEPFEKRAQIQNQLLQVNLPSNLPPLTTDLSYLERTLTELLHNACKYTPSGETISVSTQTTPDVLQIYVSNSGVEIAASELAHVFDKFYRVPNQDPWKYGGTGLGLALVKKRVEQIQGKISVTSDQGWTTFTLSLPWKIQPDQEIGSKPSINTTCTEPNTLQRRLKLDETNILTIENS